MRAKILRALAHLKAAKRHLEAARIILNQGWMWEDAGHLEKSPAMPAIEDVEQRLKLRYADLQYQVLEPADLAETR